MAGFTAFSSRVLPLLVNDIDTDQIIPARFLKVTDKLGLGENLFADWRYNADGSPKEGFVLNQKGALGVQILLAGDNFGCGSSREHAPWALSAFGFRAVISTSFADIFSSNALKNRLVPIKLGAGEHRKLVEVITGAPETEVTVDLAGQAVRLPDGSSFSFPIDSFSKVCLLNGVDELGYLLKFKDRIVEYEQSVR